MVKHTIKTIEQIRTEANTYIDRNRLNELKESNGANWTELLEVENIEIMREKYFDREKEKVLNEISNQILKCEDKEKRKGLRNFFMQVQKEIYK